MKQAEILGTVIPVEKLGNTFGHTLYGISEYLTIERNSIPLLIQACHQNEIQALFDVHYGSV